MGPTSAACERAVVVLRVGAAGCGSPAPEQKQLVLHTERMPEGLIRNAERGIWLPGGEWGICADFRIAQVAGYVRDAAELSGAVKERVAGAGGNVCVLDRQALETAS